MYALFYSDSEKTECFIGSTLTKVNEVAVDLIKEEIADLKDYDGIAKLEQYQILKEVIDTKSSDLTIEVFNDLMLELGIYVELKVCQANILMDS